jgi:PIN domain nuclease of toxin-antitoxin system
LSGSLLLDTHIALWLDTADPRLRPATRILIDDCWQTGGTIFFSAVSAWEIALLANLGRFALDLPPRRWVERFLARPGITSAPLSPAAAASSYNFPNFDHRDPGHRLLIATAIGLSVPLVTYDHKLITFAEAAGADQGFTVAS